MAHSCAASANLSVNLFRSLRQLSHASVASQRATPFLTLGHTSRQSRRILARSNLPIQRSFGTSFLAYNSSSQSTVPENVSSTTTRDETSPADETKAQPEPSNSDYKGEPNTLSRDDPSGKVKRVRPRRHRKDKPKQTEEPAEPVAKDVKTNAKKEPWQIQKEALKRKFSAGWNPRKKLSPDEMERVRHLHAQDAQKYSTPALAELFKISPEAIRRILKSKWRPTEERMAKRRASWENRHNKIWNQMSELGLRPKRKSLSPYSDAAALDTKPKDQP